MADIIKELFVSLGYKVDGNSQRNFESSIRTATLQAQLLADGLEALAKKAAGAIASVAKGYDQLHFSSARTGASVGNIKALGYAFSQVGGSVGDAQAAIEGFAKAARTNPGTEQLLKDLGVANGGDTVGTMRNLSAKLQTMPHYVAAQYAGILGLSEEQFLLLKSGKLDEYLGQYAKTVEQVGLNQKQAADRGYEFSRALGALSMTADILGEKIASDLMPPLTQFLKDTREWVIAHKDDIAAVIANIGKAAGESAGHFMALVAALKPAWEAFDETVKKLTGSTGLSVAFDALGAILLLRVLAPLRMISALMLGLRAPAWLLGLLGAGAGAAGAAAGAAMLGGGAAAGAMNTPMVDDQGRVIGNWGGKDESNNPAAPGALKRLWQNRPGWLGGKGGAAPASKAAAGKGVAHVPGLVADELRKAGMPEEGIAAVLGNMQQESGFKAWAHNDIAGGHDGLIQWDRTRWAKVSAWIRGQGGDPADPAWQTRAFIAEGQAKPGDPIYDHPKTARGFKALMAAKGNLPLALDGMTLIERYGPGEAGGRAGNAASWLKNMPKASRPPGNDVVGSAGAFKLAKVAKKASGDLGIFGSPNSLRDFGAFEPSKLSDGGFTMNNVKMVHTTNVNVNGAADPKSTALAIGKHQDGINARALTHAQGAIR